MGTDTVKIGTGGLGRRSRIEIIPCFHVTKNGVYERLRKVVQFDMEVHLKDMTLKTSYEGFE